MNIYRHDESEESSWAEHGPHVPPMYLLLSEVFYWMNFLFFRIQNENKNTFNTYLQISSLNVSNFISFFMKAGKEITPLIRLHSDWFPPLQISRRPLLSCLISEATFSRSFNPEFIVNLPRWVIFFCKIILIGRNVEFMQMILKNTVINILN